MGRGYEGGAGVAGPDRSPAVAGAGGDEEVGLRRAVAADAEAIWRLRREPSAARFQPLRTRSLAEVRERLAERAGRPLGPGLAGEVQWVIERGGEVAGWLTLSVDSREHGLGSLGYTVGERHRGRGVATAALRAVLPAAFARDGADLARLEAVAATANAASRRVLEKVGFACEGIARGYLVIGGVRVDHARYALLRGEWGAARATVAGELGGRPW